MGGKKTKQKNKPEGNQTFNGASHIEFKLPDESSESALLAFANDVLCICTQSSFHK